MWKVQECMTNDRVFIWELENPSDTHTHTWLTVSKGRDQGQDHQKHETNAWVWVYFLGRTAYHLLCERGKRCALWMHALCTWHFFLDDSYVTSEKATQQGRLLQQLQFLPEKSNGSKWLIPTKRKMSSHQNCISIHYQRIRHSFSLILLP